MRHASQTPDTQARSFRAPLKTCVQAFEMASSASAAAPRDPVDDMYAGWVMSVLMTHRQLLEQAGAINEGNKDKYVIMLCSLLAILNQASILDMFDTELPDMDAGQLCKAARLIFDRVGPPPDIELPTDAVAACQ